MYEKILVAIDNSPCSDYATDLAIDLAKMTGARLVGNHVYSARLHDLRFRQLEPVLPDRYQSPEILSHQRSVHDDLIGRGLKIISDSYMDAFSEKCRRAGVFAERKTREGRNYEQIVQDWRESNYGLIALGAHGLGQVDRSTLGSVCERVVRLVDCDVLVVRNDRPLGSGPLLVALDGSAHSFAALRVGLGLCQLYGTRIVAVAAFDPFFHNVAFKSIANVLSDEASRLFRFREQEKLHDEIIDSGLMKVYRSHLQEAEKIATGEGIRLESTVLEGKPFDVISSYVDELKPALLLLGRLGLHYGAGLTLGSTTENLLRSANCNVLVVNHQTDETKSSGAFEDNPTAGSRSHDDPREKPPAECGQRASEQSPSVARPRWTEEAEARLGRAPFFVRKMARRSIERFAQENGHAEITLEVYEQGRQRFGM